MAKAVKTKVAGEVGRDIDETGKLLYPGRRVIYWTGEGRGDLKSWPGILSHKLINGDWAVLYFQRAFPTYQVTVKYSDKPKLHSWTFYPED